jgi:CheY-like chemotaxis protein
MMTSLPSSVPIFILEDNEIDREIALRTFKKADIQNPVYFATDGIEALSMLKASDADAKQIQQPCLIITDLNLPRMDGISFIEELQNDKVLKQNITFILSTSERPSDIERGFRLNISGYFLKDDISQIAQFLKTYLGLCKFPHTHAAQ